MAAGLLVLVIALGAIAAGRGYVRLAHRMRDFASTPGTVIDRGLRSVGTGRTWEARPTYRYTVDGKDYTADNLGFARRGQSRARAEAQLAAIPDAVEVFYDPADPTSAYLVKHVPRLGYWLIAGGVVGVLVAVLLLASA
jgi:hypothetical protein